MKKIYLIISIIILAGLAFSGVFEKIDPVRAISTEGLVGWWKMDDNLATTAVVDETGTNNGTFNDPAGDPNTNAHSAVSLHDRALTFDGTDNYVNVDDSDSLDITETWTISMWVSLSDITTAKYLLEKYSNCYALITGYQNNHVNFYHGAYEPDAASTQIPITADEWAYIVYTKDTNGGANNWRGYKNGVEIFSLSQDFTLSTSISKLGIGSRPDSAANSQDGQIDQVRIYNRALSAEEIALHYFLESETRIKNATIKNAEIK